ncbi:hypothetical protein J437_LFUL006243 [Ladona fulva]|uniref:Uncharacterized protein n=1 Tax=Ladona fulva TaxID=123851 RepID=A0A8K0NZW9_LADFU|nr:hypothetical protein J437_LFUL006243 [Ladona fulva]
MPAWRVNGRGGVSGNAAQLPTLARTKWCGGGEKILRLGYRLIWGRGREKKNGVAVIISERMWGIIVEVVRVNDRILKLKLRLGDKYRNILQVYAPQTGCKEEKIEDFLEILDNQIDDAPIVVGIGNVQIGIGRTGCEEIIGPHGYGKRNKEGESLIDFCRRNNLFVGNTWFRKKPSRKITRYGWEDRHRKTVIDYMLIERECRRELIDVTAMPEEAFGRDHRAVVFKMRVGLLKWAKEVRERRIKVWKLREKERREEFINYQVPQEVEVEWKRFKEAVLITAEEVCGKTSGKKKVKETHWRNDRTREAKLLRLGSSFLSPDAGSVWDLDGPADPYDSLLTAAPNRLIHSPISSSSFAWNRYSAPPTSLLFKWKSKIMKFKYLLVAFLLMDSHSCFLTKAPSIWSSSPPEVGRSNKIFEMTLLVQRNLKSCPQELPTPSYDFRKIMNMSDNIKYKNTCRTGDSVVMRITNCIKYEELTYNLQNTLARILPTPVPFSKGAETLGESGRLSPVGDVGERGLFGSNKPTLVAVGEAGRLSCTTRNSTNGRGSMQQIANN